MTGPTGVGREVAAVMAAGAFVPLLLVIGLPQPAQLVLATILLAFLPGYAWMRLTPFTDPLVLLVLATSVSLGLTTALSLALFYAGMWSWQVCVATLGAVTICSGVPELQRSST